MLSGRRAPDWKSQRRQRHERDQATGSERARQGRTIFAEL
jgi:hypothetical protein